MKDNNRQPIKKTLSQIPVEQAHGGSGSRQLILSNADKFLSKHFDAMTKGYLSKDGIFDWHSHQNIDEFFIVISGVGVIEYETGEKILYQAGDVIYSPANIKHKLTNTGEDDNIFFFIRIDE